MTVSGTPAFAITNVLPRADRYSRVPEDWQAAVMLGLVTGTPLGACAVAVRRAEGRRQQESDA